MFSETKLLQSRIKLLEIRIDALKYLKGKWGKAALLTLAFIISNSLINFVLNLVPFLGSIATVIISPVLTFGFLVTMMKLRRDEEVGYFDFIKDGFDKIGKVWAVIGYTMLKMILPVVAIVVSIIILVVGGLGSVTSSGNLGALVIIGFILYVAAIIWTIVKGLSYAIVNYILWDNPDMPAKDIVEKSEELMNGHKWQWFWLPITFIGWTLLSAFTLYIGLLWVLPYMQIAMVVFYESVAGTPAKATKVEEESEPISEK